MTIGGHVARLGQLEFSWFAFREIWFSVISSALAALFLRLSVYILFLYWVRVVYHYFMQYILIHDLVIARNHSTLARLISTLSTARIPLRISSAPASNAVAFTP